MAQHHATGGLVDHVDRLVGQLAVVDVTAGQLDRRLDRVGRVLDLVMFLESAPEALEDLDRDLPAQLDVLLDEIALDVHAVGGVGRGVGDRRRPLEVAAERLEGRALQRPLGEGVLDHLVGGLGGTELPAQFGDRWHVEAAVVHQDRRVGSAERLRNLRQLLLFLCKRRLLQMSKSAPPLRWRRMRRRQQAPSCRPSI